MHIPEEDHAVGIANTGVPNASARQWLSTNVMLASQSMFVEDQKISWYDIDAYSPR